MPAVVVFLVALGAMIIETALLSAFSVQQWALQMPLVVTIYLGLDREFVPAGVMLALLCFPAEWFVAGVYGVYSMGLVVVFFAMQALRKKVQRSWGVARGLIAAGAAVGHVGLTMALLYLIGQGQTGIPASVAWQLGGTILTVTVATVVFGRAMSWLEVRFDPRRSAPGLEY